MARSIAEYTDMRLQGDTRFVIGLADDGDIKSLVRNTNAGTVTQDEINRINGKLSALKMNAALETQLDAVIQQNASASEELAGMAVELTGEAGELTSTMAYFKLEYDDSTPTDAPSAPLRDMTPA